MQGTSSTVSRCSGGTDLVVCLYRVRRTTPNPGGGVPHPVAGCRTSVYYMRTKAVVAQCVSCVVVQSVMYCMDNAVCGLVVDCWLYTAWCLAG